MGKFHIKWHEHKANYVHSISDFMDSDEFTDVKIASNGQTLNCHKIILAANSFYFYNLFSNNTISAVPTVEFEDFDFVALRTVIEYIYRGQVDVTDEELPEFLRVAKCLQVRGLIDEDQLAKSKQSDYSTSGSESSNTESYNLSSPLLEILDSVIGSEESSENNSEVEIISYVNSSTDVEGAQKTNRKRGPRKVFINSQEAVTPKKYRRYSQEDMRMAVDAVIHKKFTYPQAAEAFGVPSRTLYDKVKKAQGEASANSSLTEAEKRPDVDSNAAPLPAPGTSILKSLIISNKRSYEVINIKGD